MNSLKKTLFLLGVFIFLFTGCGGEASREKTFSCNGLTMTVPSHYQDLYNLGYYSSFDFAYGYGEISLVGEAILLSQLEAGWTPTLLEFAQSYAYTYEIDSPVTQKDGLVTVYFESQEDIVWSTLVAFYAFDDGFWVLQYSCPKDVYYTVKDTFIRYLSSVQIDGNTSE